MSSRVWPVTVIFSIAKTTVNHLKGKNSAAENLKADMDKELLVFIF
jgi:hypothetical protein